MLKHLCGLLRRLSWPTIANRGAAYALAILILLPVLGAVYSSHAPAYDEYENVTKRSAAKTADESVQDIAAETVAYYTKILAWFTGVLACVSFVQGIFLYRADGTARINAEATRDIAKATTALEYPIIRASYIGPELESTDVLVGPNEPYGCSAVDTWPTRFSVISQIDFKNYGRSPAFPRYIKVGFAVVRELPRTPVYVRILPCTSSPIIEEKSADTVELHFGFELNDGQVAAIRDALAKLWFFATLVYDDVQGNPHEARVCWQWGRQNVADGVSYFFDDGSAPAAYTKAS